MNHEYTYALISACLEHDMSRVKSLALQVAAHSHAKSPEFSDRIRKLAERPNSSSTMTLLQPLHGGLMAQVTTSTTLDEMALEQTIRNQIDRVLAEYHGRMQLFTRGLAPARKLLFVGPPGVGKTMAARALANALGFPMFRIELHGTIAKHLGETGANLHKIFEQIGKLRGVFLFDEFDALAAQRTDTTGDVGEMRRAVNTLLTLIEDDPSENFIIAATNMGHILDRAILRRFDEVIHFEVPDPITVRRLVERRIAKDPIEDGIDWRSIIAAAKAVGHADIVAAVDRVRKAAALDERAIGRTEIAEALRARTAATTRSETA